MTPRFWKTVQNAAAWIAIAAVLVFTIFPILWMVIGSLQTNSGVLEGQMSLADPQWHNYLELWQNIKFGVFLKNSLIICGSATILATVLASLAGYALARFRFKGSNLFGFGVLGTQMIPGIMFLLPLYMMFLWIKRSTGIPMVNTYQGMIGVYTAFFTPMSIWIMRSFFATIPQELEESAKIDGATPFQAFLRVILPVSTPGIIATAVYVFLTAWDELLFAWVLTTSSAVQTIPVGIRLYVGQYQNRYDLLMAAATVATLPVLVMFFLSQRWFVKGLTAGSVKG